MGNVLLALIHMRVEHELLPRVVFKVLAYAILCLATPV